LPGEGRSPNSPARLRILPVWGEEFDDGLGIEVEPGESGFAGGAAVGEEFGVLSFGDDVH